MKHTKKLFSLALAFIMAMALMVPAFADGELSDGSITINNAVSGQTYKIYQILYLESYNAATNAYSYKASTAWYNFVNSSDIKDHYLDVDGQEYVTWHMNTVCENTEDGHEHNASCYEPADAAAFAKLAQQYAKDHDIPAVASEKATGATVEFTGLNLGYYLVDTSLGTLCSLDTTNPDVEMYEKNGVPTLVKEVKEDSNGAWQEANDADIFEEIEFKTTVNVPAGGAVTGETAKPGAQNFVIHDSMVDELLYQEISKVEVIRKTGVGDETTTIPVTKDTDYTVTTNVDCDDPATDAKEVCDFHITFTPAFCDTLQADDQIVVTYKAKFDVAKVAAGTGYVNNAWLTYGDASKTPVDSTTSRTWDVDIFKYTVNGENAEVGLGGAKFVLWKEIPKVGGEDGETEKLYATATKADSVYTLTGWTGTKAEATEFVSPFEDEETDIKEAGKFTILGLDSDSYQLEETAAPSGYNKLANSVSIVISNTGVVNGTAEKPTGVDAVKVLNQTGAELPSTGGMGTTIFYVVGGVLMAGAAILLVTKKKMSDDQ